MQNRRTSRVAMDRPGRVAAADGRSHACIVRDISADGARLLLPQAADLPEDVVLHLDPDGERWPCRVVWRRLGEVGIVFRQAPA